MKGKKACLEDALNASRAAVEDAIVPGDGVAILKRTLQEPMRQILRNAGLEGSVVINKVMKVKNDYGFNATAEEYENLLAAGVIDPTKVVRFALQNAASATGFMLTTEAILASLSGRYGFLIVATLFQFFDQESGLPVSRY